MIAGVIPNVIGAAGLSPEDVAKFSQPQCTPPQQYPDTTPGPTADFTGTPLSGSTPLSVTFTNTSTEDDNSTYLWQKNDGSGWVNFSSTPNAENPVEDFA